MNLYETLDEFTRIINEYALFVDRLAQLGWQISGDFREYFIANPYEYHYGAIKFFERDGKLRFVQTTININTAYGSPEWVNVNEYDAKTGNYCGTQDLSIDLAKLSYALDALKTHNTFQDLKEVKIDFNASEGKFIEYGLQGRVIFSINDDELVTKRISDCSYTVVDKKG